MTDAEKKQIEYQFDMDVDNYPTDCETCIYAKYCDELHLYWGCAPGEDSMGYDM